MRLDEFSTLPTPPPPTGQQKPHTHAHTNSAHMWQQCSEYNGASMVKIPRQFRRTTANPTIFFPFTITTFSRSDFRFPLSHHHPSTNFPSPHFSHLAAPTMIQPSPSPDLMLYSTSAIQSFPSLLPSPHPITPYQANTSLSSRLRSCVSAG